MPTKPSNTVNALRDKVLVFNWDVSASATTRLFVDSETDYNVVEVVGFVSDGNPVAGDASSATLKIGHGAIAGVVAIDDDAFMTNKSAPSSATPAGTKLTYALTAVRNLPAGAPLLAVTTANGESDTGEITVQVRLRPRDKSYGNASKRPSAAQTP